MANISDKPSKDRPTTGRADHPENSEQGKADRSKAQSDDPTTAEAQKLADEANERGYRGVEADPTPNENYTLQGVIEGKPTPETDKAQAQKVREYQQGELSSLIEGVSGSN